MSVNIGININRSPNRMALALREAAVGGSYPELLADFDDAYYRANGSKQTLTDIITHTRASLGTMVDADGLLKWGPHNLCVNSATPATQSITVTSGADYTVHCTGSGSITLSGAGTGSVTEGNPLEITASTTTLTLTVVGSLTTMWAYRSDLGGMVNNPERGDSYVPTTASAVYMPRVGHHKYNGNAWVNKGVLLESEARTNYGLNSGNIVVDNTAGNWNNYYGLDNVSTMELAPDGVSTAAALRSIASGGGTGSAAYYTSGVSASVGAAYTVSLFVKAGTISAVRFGAYTNGVPSDYSADFNLTSGAVITEYSSTAHIENYGNGWYRLSVTILAAGTKIYPAIACLTPQPVSTDALFYVWGFQPEPTSTPSSYIPTNGSTVTRSADLTTIGSDKLPWPTPQYIGPELVTNGTFDTDLSGWVIGGTDATHTVTFENGGARYQADTTSPVLSFSQNNVVETGKVYQITVVISDWASGSLKMDIAGGNVSFGSNGTFIYTFLPFSTTTNINFYRNSSNVDLIIQSVSVREINPLSLSIAMKGEMDYADEGAVEAVFYQWYLNNSNRIVADLRASGVDTGKPYFFQVAAGTLDDVDGTIDAYQAGLNVPFNIASRHGTTFINGAVGGTALTENTTPVALPDLSNTDLSIAYDFMGTISNFRIWNNDLGNAGIAKATE